MFNKISSLTLSILLFLVFLGSASNLSVFLVSLAILIIATFVINVKRVGFLISHLALPTFYLLSAGIIFSIITSSTLRLIFLFIAAFLFLLIEIQLGKESHFLQNIYLLSAFSIFIGIFSAQFYFNFSIYWIGLISFVSSYFLIVQGFAGILLPLKKYFSFVIALVCGQLALGLALWPTYFLVNAIVLFCAFYLLWLFAVSVFFGKLSRKKIYWQLALVILVLAITLSSAAWKPLVS